MASIELKNVSYIYGENTPFEKKALDNINVRFESGRISGLIGHTGSGKSTLVQLLNGLLKPCSGSILIDGRDIWEFPKKIRDIRFRVGLVFQYPEYQLFEESVYKDIAFGPVNMGLDKDEIDRRVRDAIVFCGLSDDLLKKSPFELSGGQKRRVAIAGIIAMEPEVLILDEPAAGLDPMGREEILGGVWSYQRRNNSTVILVSHSMEDMARYSDNIVVMSDSRIYMTGACSEIFKHADKLVSVGLDVPQITRLIHILIKRGIDIRDDIFTIEAAKDEIMKLIRQKQKGGFPEC
ncbi:MAG: energy-coupling factor transporter ATPase [Eubacteriales bacterium]|nr:energy-coupling factor transporter ATPase [Eubacteriales bacterium]